MSMQYLLHHFNSEKKKKEKEILSDDKNRCLKQTTKYEMKEYLRSQIWKDYNLSK